MPLVCSPWHRPAVAAWIVLVSGAASSAAVDFQRDVQPLLARRCYACHGPDEQESGLRLDGRAAASATLDSGQRAIVPGDPAASAMLSRVTSNDPDLRMPPEGEPLSATQVEMLRAWIVAGADWPEHWAFRPVSRPDVPMDDAAAHDDGLNPIDAFITVALDRRGLQRPRPAPKAALLRRATYSVTGLPPTEAEMRDFLGDESPGAWERVVDRLLASPHYGEHWARHWLDLVRYADTNSFERDGGKPHAWRYRDYVIRAFNDDKPYDLFLVEQVAGDELPNPSSDALVATGWYRLGLWDDEPADKLQARFDWLDDLVSTAGQTFLGLTINCARCHDHKIDPLPQRDYYALLAFFHNITPMGDRQMNPDFIERALPDEGGSLAEVRDHEEEIARRRNEARANIKAIERRLEEHGPQALDDLTRRDLDTWKQLLAEIDAEDRKRPRGLVVTEYGTEAPDTFILFRGNPHAEPAPEHRVTPGFPRILGAAAPTIVPVPEANSSGRRTALARWLASAENPLTARVMVNRVWQHHFGRGIVRSPSNFGLMGDPPTHPELLDWLASEFVAGGWRLKRLHRLILLSAAYRAATTGDETSATRDPLNDAFWRFDPRRLSAEELRDSIHVASGVFNPKMYGPGVFPDIPAEVKAGQSKPGDGWGTSPTAEQCRRSVYIHVKRSLITPLLADFDLADTDTPCPVRFTTTQPTQALGMMNGSFLQGQARLFAARARQEALAAATQPGSADADTARIVRRVIEIALVRRATEAEVARGVALVNRLEEADGVSPSRALELYCLMVLNMNEFAYLD